MATRPPVPTSDWIRPLYFYTLCLLANLVMLYGGVQLVLGLVNTVAPRTDSSPITQIANAIVDVVRETPGVLPPGQDGTSAQQGIDAVQKATDKQARSRGITRMITGIVILAAGTLTFAMARRQAEREDSGGGRGARAAYPGGAPMAGYSPPGPQGGYGQPGSPPGGYAPPSYPQPGAE